LLLVLLFGSAELIHQILQFLLFGLRKLLTGIHLLLQLLQTLRSVVKFFGELLQLLAHSLINVNRQRMITKLVDRLGGLVHRFVRLCHCLGRFLLSLGGSLLCVGVCWICRCISGFLRSLGSGVAVHLAAERRLEKLILLTPYDSVVEIARAMYPFFPVGWLLKDRFDSAARAGDIEQPVLITSAELDQEVKLPHTLALKRKFVRAPLTYQMIAGAAHNDIVDFPDYRETVRTFIAGAG